MGIEETIRKFFFKKPKIELEGEGNTQKPSVPDSIATKCPKCKQVILESQLSENLNVCPKCGYHNKIGARLRLTKLADNGEFTELFAGLQCPGNEFAGYNAKLATAKKESSEDDAVITVLMQISGMAACVFSMEHRFMMGSMGKVVGEKITQLFEYATEHKLPVIGFVLSGGARMQEGITSLMQMAKTSAAVGRHSSAGLLYIPVLTNPTTGGVSASFAFLGDIIIAEPAALIGFAGPRVIEQTTKQKLPQGFQTSEFLLEKGFLDMIVARTELKTMLAKLLSLHMCTEAVK